jgi:DNA-directed RNA polymerase omega subunit
MSGMQDRAQELLNHAHNKYELVLTVARRAKGIRDDVSFYSHPEANKPIKMALKELAEQKRKERESVLM